MIAQQTGSDILWFLYESDGTRVGFTYNGASYYYTKNAQGDVTGITDSNADLVVEYSYGAWGKLLSTTGSMAGTVGKTNPFLYRGYYYDSESGLYYLNSRYYDPQTGRFLSADKYISTATGLLGHNMFAYCNNNPVAFSDSEGDLMACDVGGGGSESYYVDSLGVGHKGTAAASNISNALGKASIAGSLSNAASQKGTIHKVKPDGINKGKIRTFQKGITDEYLSPGKFIGKSIKEAVVGASKFDKACIVLGVAAAGVSNYMEYGYSTDFLIGWGIDVASSVAIGMGTALLVSGAVVLFAVTAPVSAIAGVTVIAAAVASYAATPYIDKLKKKATDVF